ncbi:MAG: hypothetical protein MUE41_05635 [Gemmatimonadaceae bacterium]|jgi:hypothetical protein|nr:hypothetical protein [Gemmatimonadaceae bacterium]
MIDPTAWLLPFTHIFLGIASLFFKVFTAGGLFGAMGVSLLLTLWFGWMMGKEPKFD